MLFLWAGVAKIGAVIGHYQFPGWLAIYYMGLAGIQINLVLCILNLIPIPPLDGAHVLAGMLPKKIALRFERLAPYGFFIILFLLAVGAIGFVFGPAIDWLYAAVKALFGI